MRDDGTYGGTTGSHPYTFDAAGAKAREAEFRARDKARHQAVLAERKAKREAAKAFERQEGDFIGPPNPWRLRKGRPPMKVTR